MGLISVRNQRQKFCSMLLIRLILFVSLRKRIVNAVLKR